MRLLIVGTLKGQLTTATKIAMDRGAAVTHAESIEQALAVLRSGKGADLLMVEVAVDIRDLVEQARARAHPRADRRLRHREQRPRRGRRDPRRRQGIHPAAARSRADRGRARRRRRRHPRAGLARRGDGAGDEACAADRHLRRLGADHRRIRHRQGGAGALRAHPLQPRQEAVHLRQLRRHPGAPAGIRAVRPREGRVHRRGRAPHRQVRGGDRRHAAARRNLRDGRAAAGQAAARHPGARHRPRRRHAAGAGRHPHHRHLEPQSGRGRARGHVPRGPAVPPQRREPEDPAAARAAGRRDRARAVLRQEIRRRQRRAGAAALGRGAQDAGAAPLARQRARAGEHHPPRGAARRPAPRSASTASSRRTARGSIRRAAPARWRMPRSPPSR